MHTVSEWGESFRPVYLEIGRLPIEANIPVVTAFTATASPLILEKVKNIVFPDVSPNIITANPDRPNISYRVLPCLSKNHELGELLSRGKESAERPAIVFCGSRTGTEMTARMLRRKLGEDQIFFYHAGLTKEEKTRIEKWFFDSDDGILIATCAYGIPYVSLYVLIICLLPLISLTLGSGGNRSPFYGIHCIRQKLFLHYHLNMYTVYTKICRVQATFSQLSSYS
jgi:hypothetical protein